jgi:hypothetical protein
MPLSMLNTQAIIFPNKFQNDIKVEGIHHFEWVYFCTEWKRSLVQNSKGDKGGLEK